MGTNILFISPISHFHHMDFPSSPQKKFTDPIPYYDYRSYVNNWITYLLGSTDDKTYNMLRKSNHISPVVRNNTPPYLVYWTSTYIFLREKKYRESFYYDPKAIRMFNHFVDDPFVNPLLKPHLLKESLKIIKRITVITLMNSANRDDGLFFTDFLESNVNPSKYRSRPVIQNYLMHGGFTGCCGSRRGSILVPIWRPQLLTLSVT